MSKREAIASCLYAILSAIVIIGMAVVVVTLSGCKTIKEVPVEVVKERIEYVDRVKVDSIYQHDSILIKAVGDTVYEYRDKYIYKYQFVRDTVRETVKDSIPYPVEVEKRLSGWDKFKVDWGGYLIGLILILIALIVGYCIKRK